MARRHSNHVLGYSIGPDGALTPVAGSPFTGGSGSSSVAVDLLGRFVYVTNLAFGPDGGNVSAYSIGPNGALTPVAGSPFPAGISPLSVAVDLLGRFAYVANGSSGNNVSAYSIGSNGALTPVVGSPFPAGKLPVSVTVDLLGRFAYVANDDFTPTNPGNVSAYRIDKNGALTPVPGSPFPAGQRPNSVAVDLLGRFAYVANSSSNNVSAYSIGRDGALTPIPGSPFPAGEEPTSVAVDLSGRFVYVTNGGFSPAPGNISVYRIDKNGALTPVPGSPFPAGIFPNSIAFSP